MVASIPSPRNYLLRSKYVLSPRLSKPRCHNLQCPKPNQDAVRGIMLLFTYEEETIMVSNAGSFAAFDSGVGHGESIAHRYAVAFMR